MASSDPAVIGSKVGGMLVLLLIGIIGALIPVHLRRHRMTTWMTLSNAFAGGAFLALGLFHILPDGVKDLEDAGLLIRITGETYNVAYVLVFAGYILILFCESVLFDPAVHSGEMSSCVSSCVDVEVRDEWPKDEVDQAETNDEAIPTYEGGLKLQRMEGAEDVSAKSISTITHESHADVGLANEGLKVQHKTRHIRKICESGAIFLMLALAIHGLFEGIIVGTRTDVMPVWMTTMVIFGHKWAESFALMSQFLSQKLHRREMIFLIGTFVCSSPVGVAVGMGLSSSHMCSGIFNSLGAGTILFVAGEISTKVFSDGGRLRLLKFVVYVLGSGVVFCLTVLETVVEGMTED